MKIKEIILPKEKRLIKFTNRELDDFTRYIYHPIFGLFYQYRFKMVSNFLSGYYDRILEVGFGPGLLMPTLAKKCKNVFGIDIHSEIDKIEKALKEQKVNNFKLIRADIYNIPFTGETFDVIICQSILEHLKDLDRAVKEALRVLKKDGKVIVGFPIKNKITRFLFAFLGHKDEEIHPSGHKEILESFLRELKLEKSLFFPRIFGLRRAIYFVGEFTKRYG